MRIRYKPWARKELEESFFYREHPEEIIGKWRNEFINSKNPFFLELGCGKGGFISEMAYLHPENNYLAIDLVDPMLGLAKRNIEKVYNEGKRKIDNLLITRFDIERIHLILNELDMVDGIYINFCNPWPRGKHNKRRLTHTKQLEHYKKIMKPGAKVFFKTDDDGLFEDSIRYFEKSEFKILKITRDLKNELDFWENIETEHEKMFSDQGIKIKALIAQI